MKPLARFYGPLVELSRLQSELNRLFSLFVESNKSASSGSSWDPNVDLLDDGENVRILIELPGVEAEDVQVTIRGRVLQADCGRGKSVGQRGICGNHCSGPCRGCGGSNLFVYGCSRRTAGARPFLAPRW